VIETRQVSLVIPTFNGASRIGGCLEALLSQTGECGVEILVVNDGSTDRTAEIVSRYAGVRLITQANAGPAAARNLGAVEARGELLLFTDDDCVPMPGWLDAMLAPFADPAVVGAKGIYRTRQKSLAARFVQLEYEDKYRLMAGLASIDFIDTYSAAFVRARFLEMGGYDTSFPVACAEDVELSYRMSARGWVMKFVPAAVVYHTHPDTFSKYLRKKYKFAFWRVLAVRKNPSKGIKDSHTPQVMKLQLLLAPALLVALLVDVLARPTIPATALVAIAFLLSTLPFAARALRKDPFVGLLSPLLLAARACAQLLGVSAGLIFAKGRREPSAVAAQVE
jgi:glycosyltransferase involved in cell wall biosynthesis